jgi:hypothetical protein
MEGTVQRSKKYTTYSDEQLLKLYRKNELTGESKHFLNVELDFRKLIENADQQRDHSIKSQPKNWKTFFICLLFGAIFLLMKFMK